ncbi:MAG: hypothetical protein HY321_17070 [Armatimonadetes bacterium]|nr:hypothetical protein [Armatimonadota bacterium]
MSRRWMRYGLPALLVAAGAGLWWGDVRVPPAFWVQAMRDPKDPRTVVLRYPGTVDVEVTPDGERLQRQRPIRCSMVQGYVQRWCLSPDGRTLICASEDWSAYAAGRSASPGSLAFWETRTGKVIRRVPVSQEFEALTCSPNNRLLAGKTTDTRSSRAHDRVCIWDLGSGRIVRELPVAGLGTHAFSNDSGVVAVEGEGPSVTLYDTTTWRPRAVLRDAWGQSGMLVRRRSYVCGITFSPNGGRMAVATCRASGIDAWEGAVTVWDMATGRLVSSTIQCPVDPYTEATFLGEDTLAVGGRRFSVARPDTAPEDLIAAPGRQLIDFLSVPEGLAMYHVDGQSDTLEVWNVRTKKRQHRWRGAACYTEVGFGGWRAYPVPGALLVVEEPRHDSFITVRRLE